MGSPDLNNDVIVVGAGGHAKVCIDILRSMGDAVAYCVGNEAGQNLVNGAPVLDGDWQLQRLFQSGYRRVFVAIGGGEIRNRMSDLAISLGFELVNAISPFALISPSVNIGRGVAIMPGAIVNADTTIGDLAIVNTGATIDHDCRIGKLVHIAPQCGLAGNVYVGDHSFLGIGCSVIPGIRIGSNVVVGAGGVVVKDIPDGSKVAGIPARTLQT